MNEKDYGVVVGISKYGSIKPELEGPEKDAMEFYNWLVSSDGGAIPKNNVGLVLSSNWHTSLPANLNSDVYSFEPTLTRVTAEFAKLIRLTVNNSGKGVPRVGRRLYIYLSGHGITPRVDPTTSMGLSGLLMANCMEDVNYDHVSGQAWAEWFRLSHAFAEIVLFMDCCRTDLPEVSPMSISTPVVKGGRPTEVNVFYAWSTKWNSLAWEQPLGPNGEKRSVFSYALMEALTYGPTDVQGHLTPKGLVGYLSVRIKDLRNGDGSQRPDFYPPDPDDSIVLSLKAADPQSMNVNITFGPALQGQQVVLQNGADFEPIASHTASVETWRLSLKPGAYVLVIAGADRSLIVRPGEMKVERYDA